MVLLEPIEEERKILVTKNTNTHRKGRVAAISGDEKFLAVGDVVRYTDTHKVVKVDSTDFHIVHRDGVYFKLINE